MIDKETQAALDAVVFSMKVVADGLDFWWHSLHADENSEVFAYQSAPTSDTVGWVSSGNAQMVGAFTPELMEVIDWRTWCVLSDDED